MFGWSAAETVGRTIMDLHMIYDEDVPIVEGTMLRLTDGEHPHVVSSNRNYTKDGRVIDCTWYNSVLLDEMGRMSSVMSLAEDSTERRRAEVALQEQARLDEALTAIGALVHSTLQTGRAVEAALREGAAAVGASTAVVTSHQPGAFRIDYLFGAPAEEIGRLIPDELDTPGLLALTRGETVVIDDARTDPRMSQVIAEEFDVKSLLVAPLVRERETGACLYFVFQERPHAFTQGEIDFVHHLSTSLSLALENAALYEAQRDIAVTLQKTFMHSLPTLEGLDLGLVGLTASRPGLVGGDFWDVFNLADDKVLVVIGDVAGKGVQAAALTETVHSTMRALATVNDSPAFILGKTNELLLADQASESFVTTLAIVIDSRSGEARVASAGHPGPVHVGSGICEIVEPTYGPPLGSFVADYPTTSLRLAQGESLVLYTDGVTEARQGDVLFGEERAVGIVSSLANQPAQDIADALASAASSFADTLTDDLQVLVIRRL